MDLPHTQLLILQTGSPRSINMQKNSSNTIIPTAGWSAVRPSSEARKFIWRREGYALAYDDVQVWTNEICLTGATGAKGDPGVPGTDAQAFQIVASSPTYGLSSRGVLLAQKSITLDCVKANIPETTAVTWGCMELGVTGITGASLKLVIPRGSTFSEIIVTCMVTGFSSQTLKLTGVKEGDAVPIYLKVLSTPDPMINDHFVEAGGKFITGDFFLYSTAAGNYPKWFDGISWLTVDKNTPNYSQICSAVLGDSLKQPSTILSISAIHGFFENLAASNGFIDQLSSNSAFISNFIANLVTIAYVLKSGNFDYGTGFKLDAEDGSFQIISGSTIIRLDPQNGILVQVGGSTAFQVKLDGNFIFQNNIMAISQGSSDLYKNITRGMSGISLYQNLRSQHRSGLLSTSYTRSFSTTYAKEVLVSEYANHYFSLGLSSTPGMYIAGVFRTGNTIRVIFKESIQVIHEWWNGSSVSSERIPKSFSLLSINNGASWSISNVESPGTILSVTRIYGLGLGQSGSSALICSYGNPLNSVSGTTHSHYFKALDGWTYDEAVRFMILMMKDPDADGIGALVLVKKPSDSTTTAQEEVSLNGLLGNQKSLYKILDIDGSIAVVFGDNGYVIVSNNLTTCSALKTDLTGNINGFMYINNLLYVRSTIDSSTYSVSSSGVTAVNIAFIDRAMVVDGVIVRGPDFAVSPNLSVQIGCTIPKSGATSALEMGGLYGFPIHDYSTGEFLSFLCAYAFTGMNFTPRVITYTTQPVSITPSNIASSSYGTHELLTVDTHKVIVSDDGLGYWVFFGR